MQMKLTVLGASRNTGKSLVEQAIEKEIQVTILARSPDKLPFTEEQLAKITVVKGDAFLREDVAKAIDGADVIVSSLGAAPGVFSTPRDLGVEEKAALTVLELIKETRADPPMFVMVSSTGVSESSDVPYLLRPLYAFMLKKPHHHKQIAEEAIKSSGVPYTIVRPALLTSGALTKTYRAGQGVCGYTISRNDVAHFILEEVIIENKWPNASLSIAY
ncbi:hypothetical protein GGI12_003720 [Dipsacomyces acuminosporus]|nr:hypothetical protein GGI12_003720 [Dipsacomyces acuminosporus]